MQTLYTPSFADQKEHLKDVDEESPEDEDEDPNSKAHQKRQQRQVLLPHGLTER